ncbi:hypothetical protein LCGC14_2548440 [marine sediment metagenome]|uniref:Uncharacterized protein n=1 Tax=marine sediment metagenome TaxID=412755 RepID=A0A0F9DGP6_9ZZZZ
MPTVHPVAARIFSFRHRDESERAFGRRIGASHQSLQSWRHKGTRPSRKTAERLCKLNRWSLTYLLIGTQPRHKRSPDEPNTYAEGLRAVIERTLDALVEMDELAGHLDGRRLLTNFDAHVGKSGQPLVKSPLDSDRTADP